MHATEARERVTPAGWMVARITVPDVVGGRDIISALGKDETVRIGRGDGKTSCDLFDGGSAASNIRDCKAGARHPCGWRERVGRRGSVHVPGWQ